MTDDPGAAARRRLASPGAAFLLSQLGFESARRWAERIAPLGLDPRQGMVLRVIGADGAMTQATLAGRIRVPASKVVGLVDELEAAGLVERQTEAEDRRVRMIHLTSLGTTRLAEITRASAEHEAELMAGLDPDERRMLVGLLERVADDAGLARGIHPGIGSPPSAAPARAERGRR
jgi:DNA-binding MarR family transcriptional regulator